MTEVKITREVGAYPTTSEMEVVDILVLQKIPRRSVKFLRPHRKKGVKTPDLLMDGAFWEIKSVEKLGKYTLDHAERAGLKQAENLVFDLRRLSVALEKKATAQIKREYLRRKEWRGLIDYCSSGQSVLAIQEIVC